MKTRIKVTDLAIQGGKPVRKQRLPHGRPDLGVEEQEAVKSVIESHWIGLGPKVAEFENAVRDYIGARYAVLTNSASAALHVSLLVAEVGRGDEVITSSITFPSTVNMIEAVGAKPVFVEVDEKTGLITPEAIKKAITSKTKAIIPVHLYGYPSDMHGISELAKKHDLAVIEDAAEAFGAKMGGVKVGQESEFAAFSFAVNKVITAAEGGVVVTNSEEKAELLKRFSYHGMDKGALKKYPYGGYTEHFVTAPGLKYNMTDLHAAIGLVQLERIEQLFMIRNQIANVYDEAFQGLPLVTPPRPEGEGRHGWCFYSIQLKLEELKADRDTIQEALLAEGIGSAVHFYPMHLQPYYSQKYKFAKGDFPVAESFSSRALSLPFATGMSMRDVMSVVEAVQKVLSYFVR